MVGRATVTIVRSRTVIKQGTTSGEKARQLNVQQNVAHLPVTHYSGMQIEILSEGKDRTLMADLMIEREVLIEAPAEVVWRTITEPDQMSLWFADRVELVVEPGAQGYLHFGDQGGPVVVETVDPPSRFSFRWNHPREEEPVLGNSTLVEFTLTPEGDERTRLRVTESGHELRNWPDVEKQRYADEHQEGWGEFLDRLASVVAKSSR
jgi:uncharacterized protein YndB with AHSA1/START domain